MGIYHFKTASSKIKGKNRLSSVTGFKHVVRNAPLVQSVFPRCFIPQTLGVCPRNSLCSLSAHSGEQISSLWWTTPFTIVNESDHYSEPLRNSKPL